MQIFLVIEIYSNQWLAVCIDKPVDCVAVAVADHTLGFPFCSYSEQAVRWVLAAGVQERRHVYFGTICLYTNNATETGLSQVQSFNPIQQPSEFVT